MIRIAINDQHKGKHPAELSPDALTAWWRWFNGGFQNVRLTLEELADHITAGHAYTTQHRGYRRSANFVTGQHVGLDFDALRAGTTLADMVARHPLIADHAALLHTTASHKPEQPRARVVFALDRPISDPAKYTLLARALLDIFGQADPSCKDAARLFFGAENCETLILGNVLTLEDAGRLIVRPFKRKLDQERQQKPASNGARVTVPAGDIPAGILENHVEKLLDHVRKAPDGEKWRTLRDISRTFGGYVAGGYYDALTAENWLREAIETRRATVASMPHAYKTIEEGLSHGRTDPLYFELSEQGQPEPPAPPEPAEALPWPADDSWRGQVLEDRYRELYALVKELPAEDPAWLPAVDEYKRIYAALAQSRHML